MPCADRCATTLSAIMSELSVKAANSRESYTPCFAKMYHYLSVTQQSRGNALRRQSVVDISSQESKSLTNRYVCCPTNKCIAAPFTVTSMLCADRCMVMGLNSGRSLERCNGRSCIAMLCWYCLNPDTQNCRRSDGALRALLLNSKVIRHITLAIEIIAKAIELRPKRSVVFARITPSAFQPFATSRTSALCRHQVLPRRV